MHFFILEAPPCEMFSESPCAHRQCGHHPAALHLRDHVLRFVTRCKNGSAAVSHQYEYQCKSTLPLLRRKPVGEDTERDQNEGETR